MNGPWTDRKGNRMACIFSGKIKPARSLSYPRVSYNLITVCFPVSSKTLDVDGMKTLRQQMIMLLSENKMSAKEISSAVGIREKEVYAHLSHIGRTIHSQGKKLVIHPAECMGCGYVFKKRKRFTRPGRCPICKSEHIKSPMYRIG